MTSNNSIKYDIPPVKIAITGGIGCGKSYISKEVSERINNCYLGSFDVDWSEYLYKDIGIQRKIRNLFGSICFKDNKLDKKMLSRFVFSCSDTWEAYSKAIETDINALLVVRMREINDLKASNRVVIYEVPMLFEYKLEKEFDIVICVACSPEEQIERLFSRNNFSKEEALVRISYQMPLSSKIERSDIVVWNQTLYDPDFFSSLEEKISNLISRINKLTNVKPLAPA